MSVRVQLVKGSHRGPHVGRPFHVIAERHPKFRALSLGVEGWRPRRGGSYCVAFIRRRRGA